jgi:NitT/TauT family transport system substrate-binding protein
MIRRIALCLFAALALATQAQGRLVVGILSDLDSVPLVIAAMKGFFAQEGLDVKLERFPSALNRDTALQAGAIDLAVSDLLAACFAFDGGFKVKAIMATQGAYRLMAARGVQASSLKDLKGRGIAISKNTIIEYCLDRMLESSGMNVGDVEKVIVPQMPLRLEMLKASKVDAAVLPEPLASSAALDGARFIDGSERLGVNPGIILASEAAAASKTPLLPAFTRAYDRAVAYLLSSKREEYIDQLVKDAGFPPAIREGLALPSYKPASPVPEKEIEAVGEWLFSRGLVKKRFGPKDFL